MKNRTIVFAALFVLVMPFAFAGGAQEEAPAEDAVELEFWSWRIEDTDQYEELIARFEAENPGITVNFDPIQQTEYNTVLSAALQGGTGPDIIHLRAYGGLEQFAQPGYLMPLDGEIEELNAIPQGVLRGATSIADGRVYGVPFASQTLLVYYNKGMYDELGLDEPETWDEFIANLEAMEEAEITPLANGAADGWTLEVLSGVMSPNFYGANDFFNAIMAGETDFTDPEYVASLDQLLELSEYMPDGFMGVSYVDMQAAFINEIAGHFVGGSWEAAYFQSQNPSLDFGIFQGPVENAGDTRYVSSFVDGSFGASADTEYPEEAQAFLTFLMSQESGQFFADELKLISDVPGVNADDPFLQEVIGFNENSTPYMTLVGFRYQQPTGSTLLQSALQEMFAGQIDAAAAAAQVQRGVETWFEPFQD
jgi:raffinose/stachyose/melibiose transport system substrate-binding protein